MAIVCLIFNIILIPILGIAGCAWSILIAEMVGVSLQYLRLRKITYVPFYKFITKPLTASWVMILFIIVMSDQSRLNVLLAIPIGACIYFIFLYLIRGITKEEIIQIRDMLLSGRNKDL